jgi:hypothetical protein
MKTQIKNNPENPIPTEIIAESIVKIADGFEAMNKSKLTEKAVIILLQHSTGLPMGTIKQVLNAAQDLKRDYIKKV